MAGGAKRLAALLAAASMLLLAAGCGGGGKSNANGTTKGTTTEAAATTTAAAAPLPKAAYVNKMKAIGRSLSTSLNSLGAATTAAKAAVALTAVQTDLRKAADRIESITPPQTIKTQHAQLAKAVRDFADELDPVIVKLKAGTMTALQTVPTLKGLAEIQNASTAIANKGYKIGG
jgi:predicted amidohydrolase YtcJ